LSQGITSDGRPLEPIGYATAELNRRPTLVTAVAVMSICVGSLSLAFNCFCENYAIARMQLSVRSAAQIQRLVAMQTARVAAARMAATSQPTFRALTAAEIDGAINYFDAQLLARGNAGSLNVLQKAALKVLLSKTGQVLVDPDVPLGSQISGQLQKAMIVLNGDGSVMIAVNHGSPFSIGRVWIDNAGHQSFPVRIPSPPQFLAPLMTSAQYQQIFHDQHISALISAIIFGISALLAILLLPAGVYLLRMNPRGIWLHWVYVAIKLPLSLVAGTALVSIIMPTRVPLLEPLHTPLTAVGCAYSIFVVMVLLSGGLRFR
jgi:hypothetical protein